MTSNRTLTQAGVRVLDCEHQTPVAQTTGHPYIAIPDIQGGRVVWATTRRISEADLATWTRRTTPRAGDVLVTRRGRVGDTAALLDDRECAIGQNLVILRADPALVAPSYLRWATRSPIWWNEVNRILNVGAVFSSLNVSDIGSIVLPFPSLPQQVAIGEILDTIDDKIAANVATADTAADLAQAQFAAMDKAQEVPLSSIARFVNGRAFTKEASGAGRVVIRIAELNSGLSRSTVFSEIEVAEDHLARPGDLLFAWSGSLTVRRWYRPEAIINQHIFKVVPRDKYPVWLVHQALLARLDDFKSIAADKATTMGHIQRRDLDEPVAMPTQDVVDNADELMTGLWRVALAAEVENLALVDLRETLLASLISGHFRVKDAERRLEDPVDG